MASNAAVLPDESRGPVVLGACLTSTLLALLCIAARLAVRLCMIHHVGPDDYAIIIAMAISLSGMGIIIAAMADGGGRHIEYLDQDAISNGLRLNYVLAMIFVWAITITKISIALFLMRIAPSRRYRFFLWAVVAVLLLYTFATFMATLLQCQTVSSLWSLSNLSRTNCWSPEILLAIGEVHASLNIFTDVLLAVLPIPMLWNVQINPRVKATLVGIIGLGAFASAAAVVRAVKLPTLGKSGDLLWEFCSVTIWNVTECNTGIIAASLPTLKPLFKRILDSSLGYTSRSKAYTLSHRDNSALHQHHNNSHHMHTFVRAGADPNLSEESILPIPAQSHGGSPSDRTANGVANAGGRGIVKTTAVVIKMSSAPWPATSESDITTPERRIEDRV